MAIVKMKKIRLLVSRSNKDEILRDLMLMGCLEISSPEYLLEDEELSSLVSRENDGFDRYASEQLILARGLDIISQYVPSKSGLFPIKPVISNELLLDEKDSDRCIELAKTLDSLDGRIRRIISDEYNENNLIESLEPWAPLQISLNSEGTSTSAVILGAIASSFDIDSLKEQLREATEESEAFLISSHKEQHYLCVICLRDKQSLVSEVLRRFNFSVTSLKNLSGTAADNIAQAKARLENYAEQKATLEAQIIAAAELRDTLRLCYDHISTKLARAEASEKLLCTEYSHLLTGWAPAACEPDLMTTLSKYDCAWEFTDPLPEEYADVPVHLKNNLLTRPLSMVTEMYSLPAYGSVDPNPPMMPFFVLFYGLMMADMGYGLIMMIAAIVVKRKKPQGGMRNFFDLLLLCGISTFIVGALTCGLFGNAPEMIASIFNVEFKLYEPLIDPVNNTMTVLVGALALGAIHVLFGMAISFVHQIRNGKAIDALLDIGSWWVIFAGIALGALGVTWWVALAGGAVVVLTAGRDKKNIFARILGGIGKLYDITAYFGDILSYSRVMALMLAGGVIAMVFNTLGALTGNIVTFLLIFLLGHALNFGLNLLGCFVHDMRLQCLEFFGKFYEDGGKPFRPLSVKTKYNNIVE